MLEPIDEKDLDLKNKFLGGVEKNTELVSEGDIETALNAEVSAQVTERKESAMEKDGAYNKIISKIKNPTTIVHDDISNDVKMANAEIDYESKVNNLVGLAENKGVAHAVQVAKKLEDSYLLDELHDRLLAQDLHDALVRKGLIISI
jgi:hypothetical protein